MRTQNLEIIVITFLKLIVIFKYKMSQVAYN